MTLLEALILGLIQGITEFLPISSSAHVQIAQELMGLSDLSKPQLTAFIATIQIGTELAILIFFGRTILEILKSWFTLGFRSWAQQDSHSRMGWFIIVGTLPLVVLGLSFEDLIENDLRQLWIIAVTMIVFGLVLGYADRVGKRNYEITDLNWRSALIFGLGQALALIPGVSRSGGSITAGLLLGFSREAAARYSLLLAVPAVLGTGAYQFIKSYGDLPDDLLGATILATVVSFISGYVVIGWLLKYLLRGSFMPFVIWRVLVGSGLLIWLAVS